MLRRTAVILSIMLFIIGAGLSFAADKFESDTFKTKYGFGDLKITFIGHGSLMFEYKGKTIYADPWSKLADYSTFPKADLILITHEHGDHLDPGAVVKLLKDGTEIRCSGVCADSLNKIIAGTKLKNVHLLVYANGKSGEACTLKILTVPAYNLSAGQEGRIFHPKGSGNGYVVDFGGVRVYIAGDTENIPEMKNLKDIDIAFLPVNKPYTMTPEMAADAAKMFNPKILYPYHYGETDLTPLKDLLKNTGIDVRIRKMQ